MLYVRLSNPRDFLGREYCKTRQGFPYKVSSSLKNLRVSVFFGKRKHEHKGTRNHPRKLQAFITTTSLI